MYSNIWKTIVDDIQEYPLKRFNFALFEAFFETLLQALFETLFNALLETFFETLFQALLKALFDDLLVDPGLFNDIFIHCKFPFEPFMLSCTLKHKSSNSFCL